MRLNAFFGDRRWLDVLRVHNEVVKRMTKEHGGSVVKSQGDGFMSRSLRRARAVTCAQASGRRRRPSRPRLDDPRPDRHARGRDRAGGRRLLRSAVNYAARVASAAEGGEIVVSALVTPRRQTASSSSSPRQVELKGIEGLQAGLPVASDDTEPLAAVE